MMNDYYFKLLSCQDGLYPTIRFNSDTKKYYVYINAEIREDNLCVGVIGAHKSTIEEAINSFNQVISGKTLFYQYLNENRSINIPDVNN